MIAVELFDLPMIDPEHRNVVRNMGTYLDDLPSSRKFTRNVRDFVASLWADFQIDVEPLPWGRIPNYARFIQRDHTDGALLRNRAFMCFAVSVDQITPDTWRLTLRADWWAMFMDGDTDIRISGTLIRSTAARYLTGAVGHYAVPADMSEPREYYLNPFVLNPTYRVLITFQCYLNNDWPAPDGTAYQVTALSRNTFTAAQIAANADSVMSNPAYYYDDGANLYNTVISISRRQIVPTFLCPALPALTNDALTNGDDSSAPGFRSEPIVALMHTFGTQCMGPRMVELSADVATNYGALRAFIGNRHTLVALPDIREVYDGTSRPFARLWCSITPTGGFVCELFSDGVVDLSQMFDAPYSYNSDSEMAFQAGDARSIGLVSAGVSGTAQAVAGTVMLASGNPLGLASIAAAGVSAAGAVNAAQYRGRQVVSTSGHSAITELDLGIICAVLIAPVNAGARTYSAVVGGYQCQQYVSNVNIANLIDEAPPDDWESTDVASVYETFRFADDVAITEGLSGLALRYATPTLAVREDIRGALMRGVAVWGNTDSLRVGDYSTLLQIRGAAYA